MSLTSQWLEIKDTDDEKTKARKRKLLKSAKSKLRFQQMDMVQKDKQDNWQSFMHGKGQKRKVGFLTGGCTGVLIPQGVSMGPWG